MRAVEVPSAETAIEQARETWLRGYRDAQAAGREIPVVDVPRELGDVARTSVEATTDLARMGGRRSYTVNIDLRALEAQRQARLITAAKSAPGQSNGNAKKRGKRKGRSTRGA